jgi:ribosome-binding factor A
MKAYKRSQRVADQIKRDVSAVIAEVLSDRPDLIVTVSSVEVTDDLRYARIFYTVLGEEKKINEVAKIFERATRHIQVELGHRIRMRRTPEISLMYDKSLIEGMRVVSLIDELTEETDKADEQED